MTLKVSSKNTRYMNISPESEVSQTDCRILNSFEPITLEEMDSIRLMNRIDSKYLTDTRTLELILTDAAERGYRIFENGCLRLHGYDSVYFDTADLWMFKEHRRGKALRQKVRTRVYMDSGLCFLEVKRKNNHGRTKKKRMEIAGGLFRDFRSDVPACSWLDSRSRRSAEEISPSLETMFRRMTLVNAGFSERITIDTDVSFRNLRTGASSNLGNAVIIELKQDGRLRSEMQDILLDKRVKTLRISKYCIGIVSTDPAVHPGRFKEKLRAIEKVNRAF